MKTTEECIKYISTHPWLKKQFLKLKQEDILAMADFLDIKLVTREEFAKELTKSLLDRRFNDKRKLIIDELLSCAITYRFN